MKLTTLEDYINNNIELKQGEKFFNESFCNLVFDYLSMKGYEITKTDKKYLEKNGYIIEDFEDEYKELKIF